MFWSFVVCTVFDNDNGNSANDEIDKTIETTKGKHSKGRERMDNSKRSHFTLASRHLLDDGSANSFGYFDDESFQQVNEKDMELCTGTSTFFTV